MFNNVRHMFVVAAIAVIAAAGACQSCTEELSYNDVRWFEIMGHEYIMRDSITHAHYRINIDDYTDVIDDGDYIVAKENYVNRPSEANWEAYLKANKRLLKDEEEYLNKE